MTRPLDGMRIWCTRPGRAGERSCWRFHELGAELTQAPTVYIEPVLPGADTLAAIRDRATDIIVGLTSPTSTDNFIAACTSLRPDGTPWPAVAVGDRTALRARELGLEVIAVAARATASDLGGALVEATAAPVVLLPGSNLRRAGLAEDLRESGREVVELLVQETLPVQAMPAAAAAGDFDLMLAYSPSALAFMDALDEPTAARVRLIPVAVMGPTTGEEADRLDLSVIAEPRDPHEEAMIDMIIRWWASAQD